MPEFELPWLVAGLPVYYHRSNGDRVSATVVGPSPRGGRRVSIRYELGGEEVLYEHALKERFEFTIRTAESPDSPQPVPPNLCTMRRRWTLCWSPNYPKWKLKPLELMIMSQKPPDLKMIVHTMRHLWTFKCPPLNL